MELSVMTFNLRFGLADDGDNSWEHRKKIFPEFFKRYQPDFIGFQEANNFQTDFLATLLSDYHYIGKRDPSPDYWQNNLIFYRKDWKCVREKHYFLSETPEVESKLPDSKWPRQCVIGQFEKNGNKLIHVNTHLDFKESVQGRSAELIKGFMADFPETLPVFMTGDFNAPPGSEAYDILMKEGFKDPFEGSHSSTFHGFSGEDSGDHIDWILFRGEVGVTGRKIIRDSFSGLYPTDHFPVVADFRVTQFDS